MYKRILLAYDGSREGRMALREGALIAREHGSDVFLLAIAPSPILVDPMIAYVPPAGEWEATLEEGLSRLRELGLTESGALVCSSDPAGAIASYATRINADLAVIGQVRRSWWSRLMSESTPAALIDKLPCSLLISNRAIADEDVQSKRSVGR